VAVNRCQFLLHGWQATTRPEMHKR
jgi:hypothetical protein